MILARKGSASVIMAWSSDLARPARVRADLPADHPPTLFLHGGADTTVPIGTAQDYYQKLQSNGIETEFVQEPAAGHEWIVGSPAEVVSWFLAH